jgi:DNA invertase Pin-like site-specific DNA recombinase
MKDEMTSEALLGTGEPTLDHDRDDEQALESETPSSRFAIYARTARKNGLAIAEQIGAARALLRRCGVGEEAVAVNEDDGFPAGSTLPPGLGRLVRWVAEGGGGVVVVQDLTRLSRDLGVLLELLAVFDAHGIELVLATGNESGARLPGDLRMRELLTVADFFGAEAPGIGEG